MSSVFGIRHTSSGSTSHGSDTRRRLSERPEDEVRGKADSSTNELTNNRGAAFGRPTKGAGGLRPPALFVFPLFFTSLSLLALLLSSLLSSLLSLLLSLLPSLLLSSLLSSLLLSALLRCLLWLRLGPRPLVLPFV